MIWDFIFYWMCVCHCVCIFARMSRWVHSFPWARVKDRGWRSLSSSVNFYLTYWWHIFFHWIWGLPFLLDWLENPWSYKCAWSHQVLCRCSHLNWSFHASPADTLSTQPSLQHHLSLEIQSHGMVCATLELVIICCLSLPSATVIGMFYYTRLALWIFKG